MRHALRLGPRVGSAQLDLLPGMGADYVQGFLLARPEPPDVVAARLPAAASVA